MLDTAAEAYRRLGEGDPEGAVDTWLEAAFDPGYRDILQAALPGAFQRAIRDADAPFGVEVPSLQDWPRGPESRPPGREPGGDHHRPDGSGTPG